MLMILLLLACFCVVLSSMLHVGPVNIVENRFGWLGIKIGFFDEKELENSWSFWTTRWRFVKRSDRRLSELPWLLPKIVECQFAQAWAKRVLSEQIPNFRHCTLLKRATSEPQANCFLTFDNWVCSSEQSFAQVNWVLCDHFLNFVSCIRTLI